MADKYKIKRMKRVRKKLRVRKKIVGTSERPRLAVFRSSKNIYAQLIDDIKNQTLAGVSTLSPDLKGELSQMKNRTSAAKLVGKSIAEKAKALKVKTVIFDRGAYLYHGRVKALAEGARENGLEF